MGDVSPLDRRRSSDRSPARDLAAARRLVREGRWTHARTLLADGRAPSAESLELRSHLAYLLGDSRACFEDLAASPRWRRTWSPPRTATPATTSSIAS